MSDHPSLGDVDESTAVRIYDSQFEGCHDVNADEDPRPCISFYIMTDFGIAEVRSAHLDGFGNEAHHLGIPNLGKIPERNLESFARHKERNKVELVDAERLPSQRDPVGKDPITELPIEIVIFGFDVKPWAQRECARCGRPLDATSAERCPDGWLHEDCDPSNWDDASLTAFASDGGVSP